MGGYLIGGRLRASGGLDAGEITIRALIPSSAAVELVLNDYGTLGVDVRLPLIDPVTKARVDLSNELVPGRDFLGWVEGNGGPGDVIMEAGPIWSDPFTFPFTSKIVAAGLGSYFEHRRVLPVLGPSQLPRDVTSHWTGLHLRTMHKRLIKQANDHPLAGLPIDYEADVVGTHEREYPGSDRTPVWQAVTNLTQVENGPDAALRPKWGADRKHVRWDLVTGNPRLTQAGADLRWDVSVPEPHATIVSHGRDARTLASHAYFSGSTIDGVRLEAKSAATELTAAGFPILEMSEDRSSVLRVDTLQAYADEATARGSAHTETFQVRAQRDKHPTLGTYWPGHYASLQVGENPRIPAGPQRVRIARMSFSSTGPVSIDFAPERIASGYPVPSSNRRWLADRLRDLSARIDELNRGA